MKKHTVEIRERLNALAEKNGMLTPEMVVRDAWNPDSPLHACFDWNQETAAYKHWLNTARGLIRGVKVTITTSKTTVRTVAYVRDPEAGNKQGYIPTAKVRNDKDLARSVLIEEFGRVAACLRRAKDLAAAFDLNAEVTEMYDRINVLHEIVISDADESKPN